VEFDGERVRSARQFTRLVQETPPGRQVRAVVQRGTERVTLDVAPAQGGGVRVFGDLDDLRRFDFEMVAPPPPPTPPAPAAPPAPPRIPELGWLFGGGSRLGISTDQLTPQLAEYFGAKDGVLVRSVEEGSSAARAGLRAGDVIVAFNGERVTRVEDIRRQVQRLDQGGKYQVEILRDRKPLRLEGELEPRRERRGPALTV
jgi:serine protease Do